MNNATYNESFFYFYKNIDHLDIRIENTCVEDTTVLFHSVKLPVVVLTSPEKQILLNDKKVTLNYQRKEKVGYDEYVIIYYGIFNVGKTKQFKLKELINLYVNDSEHIGGLQDEYDAVIAQSPKFWLMLDLDSMVPGDHCIWGSTSIWDAFIVDESNEVLDQVKIKIQEKGLDTYEASKCLCVSALHYSEEDWPEDELQPNDFPYPLEKIFDNMNDRNVVDKQKHRALCDAIEQFAYRQWQKKMEEKDAPHEQFRQKRCLRLPMSQLPLQLWKPNCDFSFNRTCMVIPEDYRTFPDYNHLKRYLHHQLWCVFEGEEVHKNITGKGEYREPRYLDE